jgi:hypothetical protein
MSTQGRVPLATILCIRGELGCTPSQYPPERMINKRTSVNSGGLCNLVLYDFDGRLELALPKVRVLIKPSQSTPLPLFLTLRACVRPLVLPPRIEDGRLDPDAVTDILVDEVRE